MPNVKLNQVAVNKFLQRNQFALVGLIVDRHIMIASDLLDFESQSEFAERRRLMKNKAGNIWITPLAQLRAEHKARG